MHPNSSFWQMTDSPFAIALTMLAALISGRFWWQDFQASRTGAPNPSALPGAVDCPKRFLVAATFGAILLVGLESAGEILLGLAEGQKDITVLFLGAMLAAAIVEEIVFRGYLVVHGRGRALFVAGAVGASLLFALMHDFLWQYQPAEGKPWWHMQDAFSPSFTGNGWYSFSFAFAVSLYFYWVRFHPHNTVHSLLPCFLAHAARNVAVFAMKAAQGHVTGWF